MTITVETIRKMTRKGQEKLLTQAYESNDAKLANLICQIAFTTRSRPPQPTANEGSTKEPLPDSINTGVSGASTVPLRAQSALVGTTNQVSKCPMKLSN